MEKWRIKIVHLVYFGLILSLVVFMSIGCGGGSSGSGGGTGGGSGATNPVGINDDTPAGSQDASVAFNSAGDAMAVWLSNDGTNFRILYSFYTQATDTWSIESELATTYHDPAISSNGTDFMVVWTMSDVYAREYIVSSGTWGAQTTLDSLPNSASNPNVASNGTGYCAVWGQYDGLSERIHTNLYTSSGWGTATTVDSGTGNPFSPEVASNGTGYCVTWTRNLGGVYDIYASIYTAAWGAENLIDALAGYADYPQVASDGAGYCVTWQQNDVTLLNSIYANIYTGAWSGATLIESGGTYNAYYPKIAADGSGYGVVWRQFDGVIGDRVCGNKYDNTLFIPSWSGDGTLDSGSGGSCYNPSIAASSTGFGVTWRQYDSGSSSYNVLANTYDRVADAWGTETLLESGSGDAYLPRCASDGTGYGVVWIQDDGLRNTVYTNINSGSGWGTERNLMQNQYHGGVTVGTRFAANSAGDVLAIWRQYDKDTDRLYGCLYSGGAWGPVFPISNSLYYYDVSSYGNGFMIVHNQYGQINAVPYDTTTGLGTEVIISGNRSYNCRITTNGNGYCATWRQSDPSPYSIYANIYNGSSWDIAATLIDSGLGIVYDPQVASNGTGYCITWTQEDGAGNYDIWVRIHNGSSWAPAATIDSDSNEAWYSQIASDGTGYCVTWQQNSNIYANVFEGSPLNWTGASLVELGPGWVGSPEVASNGTSYSVTWVQDDGINTSIYANFYDGLWGSETTIESGAGHATYPRVVSNGNGYCFSWAQDDGTAYSAYAKTFNGSTWGTERNLESSDTEVINNWDMWINVVAVQNTYTIGWLQQDDNDPLVNNLWAYSGLSD